MKDLRIKFAKIFSVFACTILLAISLLPVNIVKADQQDSSLGVSDYTSGSDWDIIDSKGIEARVVDKPLGDVQYLQVELVKGMRFVAFPWNDAWGTVGTNVQGSPSEMNNSDKGLLSGNSIEVDSSGKTTLVYEIASGTETINLSGKISVKPDELLTYNNDEIENAITVKLLDSSKNVVKTSVNNVKVVTSGNDGIIATYWRGNVVVPGSSNQHIGDFQIHKVYRGENYNTFKATVTKVVLTLPEGVIGIDEITSRSTSYNVNDYTFDSNTRILTISDEIITNGQHNPAFNIFATIDSNVPSNNPVYSSQGAFGISIKYYDGQEETIYSGITGYEYKPVSDFIVANAGMNIYKSQPAVGYPTLLHEMLSFTATKDLTDNQLVTWSADVNTVDIVGVYFPIGKEGNVKVTKVTFDDGSSFTPNATNIGTIDGNVRYVTVSDLKALGLSNSAKYIRSITADCGTFDTGTYVATSQGNKGFPVGYFSDYIVNNSTSNTLVPITYSVNGNDVEYGMPYSPKEVVSSSINLNTTSATVQAGGSFSANVTLTAFTRISTTNEPHLYIVVPEGMNVNTNNIIVKDNNVDVTNDLVVKRGTVTNESGKSFNVINLYVKDSVLYGFTDEAYTQRSKLEFSIPFDVSENASLGTIDFKNYIFTGKGEIGGEFAINRNTESYLSVADMWDFDGDNNRTETDVLKSRNKTIEITENKNISVSGYLTNHNETGSIEAYDPGADGSSDVNAVTFTTGKVADYHVVIKSTLDTNTTPASVDAFIPIPNANINGSDVSPVNIDNTNKHYQFNDFAWPMVLTEPISNPNSSVYSITYWLNEVNLDSSTGRPVETTNTVKRVGTINNSELDKVVLVEINGSNIPMGSENEFVLPLKVNVTSEQASEASLNGSKNIFRPYFYRKSDGGSGYNDGNYVAAKLSIGAISGITFIDANGNGLYNPSEGDKVLGNVKVELYKGNTLVDTATTSSLKGEYIFNDLENGVYTIKVYNPKDSNTYHFTKEINDNSNNYTVNSDVTAANDNMSASVNVDIPYTGSVNGGQLYINAGLTSKVSVIIRNDNPSKGKINNVSTYVVDTIETFPNSVLQEPSKQPNTGYNFVGWKINGVDYSFTTPIEAASTITGYWDNIVKFLDSDNSVLATYNVNPGETLTNSPTPNAPSGKQFVGWLSDNGGTYDDDAVKALAIGQDTTFTAVYAQLGSAVVIFDFNGGEDASGNKYLVLSGFTGENVAVPNLNNIKKAGYSSPIWDVTPVTIFGDPNTTTTYTLKWTANRNEVRFVVPNGTLTATTTPINVLSGNKVNVTPNATANPGFVFSGYWLSSEPGKGAFSSAEIKDYVISGENSPVTFTAVMVPNGQSSILFDFAGGLVNGKGSDIKSGTAGTSTSSVVVPSPTRESYVFKKWDKDIPSTFPSTIGAIETITAVWAEDKNNNGQDDDLETKYKVVYKDGENGLVFADREFTNLLVGTDTPRFDGSLERENYIFKNWNPSVANKINASDAVSGVITYTAVWAEDNNNNGQDDENEDRFTITYKDGLGGQLFADIVYDNVLTLTNTPKPSNPIRDKYVFKGWNPSVAPKVSEDKVYTATWGEDFNENDIDDADEKHYTITYLVDDSVYAKFEDVLVGLTTPMPEKDPTKTGYNFVEWTPAIADKVENDAEYKAVFNPIEYTVVFDGNDADGGAMLNIDAEYDLEFTPDNSFYKDGYDFEGWNTKKDGSGQIFKPGQPIKNLTTTDGDEVVLYAIWNEFSYNCESGDNAKWIKNSNSYLVFVFKRSSHDELTYNNFVKNDRTVTIDGEAVDVTDYSLFDTASGSLILTVRAKFLQTQAIGTHELSVDFGDGVGVAKYEILKQSTPIYNIPKTGIE